MSQNVTPVISFYRRWIAPVVCALAGHRPASRELWSRCLRCGVGLGLPPTTQTPTMPPVRPPHLPSITVGLDETGHATQVHPPPGARQSIAFGIPVARVWAYLNDPIVHDMTMAGRSPDEIINALARENEQLGQRIDELTQKVYSLSNRLRS